jgi:hypothetical protein
MSVTEIQCKICLRFLIYFVKISTSNKLLIKTDLPLNIPISLLMALSAEAHLAEEQLQYLRST